LLQHSLAAADRVYNILVGREDYSRKIDDQANRLLLLCRYAYLPKLERDLVKTRKERDEWKIFLSNTLSNNRPPYPVIVLPKFAAYAEKKDSNYNDALKLLQYHNDSVWYPLFASYGHNRRLANLKRNLDVSWNRYYIYTGDSAQAFRIAKELSAIPVKIPNYTFYLVATCLSFGKYSEAEFTYRNMQKSTRPYVMQDTNSSLLSLLKKIKEKGIGVADIDRFRKEFDLDFVDD
jgi:hypothetical protein